MKIFTVMLAGGTGSRMNAPVNKTLLSLCGKSVIRRSVEAFSGLTDRMVVVCHPKVMRELMDEAERAEVGFPLHFVPGGDTRQQSVLNGLRSLAFGPEDLVLVHDAARCLVSPEIIESVIASVVEHGSGVPGVPVSSTYKICDGDGWVSGTPDRSRLYEVQTPQGFVASDLLSAALRAAEEGFAGTDDASLMERYGYPVRIVAGSPRNLKLTTRDDWPAAEGFLKGAQSVMRVGMGYDVHRLVENRKLILCGVEIPNPLGLLGHSDADVALHALMDALLGACALGDIGRHFPDSEERYRGISSLLLLEETNRLVRDAGWSVVNVDITIVAQKPKLLPWIPQMIQTVARTLGLAENAVNVKATTTEKLGFEGREEGISAYAVCSVE